MFALNVLLTRAKSVAISRMGKLISHLLYQWENNLSRGLRYNEKLIFSWPKEKISEAEHRKLKSVAPLKTERKTKYGNREVTYQEAYNFADLHFDTIQWLIHPLPCVLCLRDFRLVKYFAHRKAV